MKKTVFVVIAFLLALSFGIAQYGSNDTGTGMQEGKPTLISTNESETEIEVEETDNAVGERLAEQAQQAIAAVRPAISRIHLVGNGLAISEQDPFDFMHARAVIGAVRLAGLTTSPEEPYSTERLGVLMLDEQRYHLKDVAVSLDEISAEIYGPTTTESSEPVGEILVKRFEKPGRDVWAGNMALNGKAYTVYFLGVKRQFRLAEITQKIGEYCEENTDDLRCQRAYAQCASNPEECRERVKSYCENNPENLGCLQIQKLYCLGNATDERCREYLEGLCEKYPRLGFCATTTVNGEQVTTINSGAVQQVTVEAGETLRNMITSKIRTRLGIVSEPVPDEAS